MPGNSFQEVKLCIWSTAVFLPYYIFKCCYVTLHVFGFTWGSFTLSYTYRLTGNSWSLKYQDEFDTKIYHVPFINFIIVPFFDVSLGLWIPFTDIGVLGIELRSSCLAAGPAESSQPPILAFLKNFLKKVFKDFFSFAFLKAPRVYFGFFFLTNRKAVLGEP